MKLVDEIIDLATDDKAPISVVLRKCLVLAHDLKNDRLKSWADNELNGYDRESDLPVYRKIGIVAKGHFLGPFGAQISSQPLPSVVLDPKHRHFAESVRLVQPIIAYEGVGKDAIIEWPANLTATYQSKFIEGYGLNRAWQEIPGSVFSGLVDTVRTRVLRLALELRDDLQQVGDNPAAISRDKVDQIITNFIFGGTTIIAGSAHDFTQVGSVTVSKGDMAGLEAVLRSLGLPLSDMAALTTALTTDGAGAADQAVGKSTEQWLKDLAGKFGKAGVKIGVDVATAAATRAVNQYLGMP